MVAGECDIPEKGEPCPLASRGAVGPSPMGGGPGPVGGGPSPVGGGSGRLGGGSSRLGGGPRTTARACFAGDASLSGHRRAMPYRVTDRGSRFTGMDWTAFARAHDPERSMSRRGDCRDDAVAEHLPDLLARERIGRRTCGGRKDAGQDVPDRVVMFHDPRRRHARNRMSSSAEIERQRSTRSQSVRETRGPSMAARDLNGAASRTRPQGGAGQRRPFVSAIAPSTWTVLTGRLTDV